MARSRRADLASRCSVSSGPCRVPAPNSRARTLPTSPFIAPQIAEIDAELSRGVDPCKIRRRRQRPGARRLIAVRETKSAAPESSRGRMIAADAGAVAGAGHRSGLYSRVGHPDLPDMPLQARLDAVAGENGHCGGRGQDRGAYQGSIRTTVAPMNSSAPVYLRLGRYDDAVHAREAGSSRLLGKLRNVCLRTRRGDRFTSPRAF